MEEINLFGAVDAEYDKRYTTKINIPQYLPDMECPSIDQLVGLNKYNELISNINKSNVSEKEKQFLRLAATRHLAFTYSRIADYYAHASKEMQELMEQSALVIIDVDDAIANGYMKLSKDIRAILERNGEIAGE